MTEIAGEPLDMFGALCWADCNALLIPCPVHGFPTHKTYAGRHSRYVMYKILRRSARRDWLLGVALSRGRWMEGGRADRAVPLALLCVHPYTPGVGVHAMYKILAECDSFFGVDLSRDWLRFDLRWGISQSGKRSRNYPLSRPHLDSVLITLCKMR